MPYREGVNLSELPARVASGSLDLAAVVSIFRQLVEGGKELAENNVLPRDTHAANTLLQEFPGAPVVHFVDFGDVGSSTNRLTGSMYDLLEKINVAVYQEATIDSYLEQVHGGITEFSSRLLLLWRQCDNSYSEVLSRLDQVENLLATTNYSPTEIFDRAGLPPLD